MSKPYTWSINPIDLAVRIRKAPPDIEKYNGQRVSIRQGKFVITTDKKGKKYYAIDIDKLELLEKEYQSSNKLKQLDNENNVYINETIGIKLVLPKGLKVEEKEILKCTRELDGQIRVLSGVAEGGELLIIYGIPAIDGKGGGCSIRKKDLQVGGISMKVCENDYGLVGGGSYIRNPKRGYGDISVFATYGKVLNKIKVYEILEKAEFF